MFIHCYVNCVYGHALSCTERSVQACHGNAFGVRSRKQKRRKKSWLFTERGLGFQTAGSGTRTWDFRVSSPAL